MKTLDMLAALLLVVGGLNWGLYGLLDVDLVAAATAGAPALAPLLYATVGLAAVYQVLGLNGLQRRWNVAPVEAR